MKKWCRVHNRLLIGMSVVDIFYSTALSFSYIPAQRGECSFGYGTVSTCNAQGFFVQLGTAIPLYITMMSLHSLLSIAYNVPEEVAKKYEAAMHAVCILPPLAMATTGSIGRVFFGDNAQCWLLTPSWYEDNCQGNCYSWSKDAGKILLIATISMAFISEVLMYSFLFKIYLVIRKRAVRMRRFTFAPSGNQIRLRREPSSLDIAANEAAKQALLYVSGHAATCIWTLLYLFVPTQDKTFHSVVYIGTAICLPLHGFFNFLTYIRPRFLIIRRKRKEFSFLDTMKLIICASGQEAPMRCAVAGRTGPVHPARRLSVDHDYGNRIVDGKAVERTGEMDRQSLDRKQ